MSKIKPSVMTDYAWHCLNNHYGYIWGQSGGVWTQKMQDRVMADPKGREQTKKYGQKWVGHNVVDCSGIPYHVTKTNGCKCSHSSYTQYLDYCSNRGRLSKEMIDSLIPGAGIFQYSNKYVHPYYHVGIYVGDGYLIEAKGTFDGVVKTPVTNWLKSKSAQETHYGYWKFVDWTDSGIEERPYMETLKRGSKGDSVKKLQEKLNQLGFNCGEADGIFGINTYNAVKAFQLANGLTADGIAGYNTLTLLQDIPVTETPQTPIVPIQTDFVNVQLPRETFEILKKALEGVS